MSAFKDIEYEVSDRVAFVRLNRPDKLNAMTLPMQRELSQALWEADHDQNVAVVILSGNGRSFSAGYDLTGSDRFNDPVSPVTSGTPRGAKSFDDDAWNLERAQRYRMALFDMHKPVVCKVHGHCVAGGTDLALLSDFIICADDATFGFPAARNIGSLPNNLWVYNVGPQWAKRLLMTGDVISGKQAEAINLVLRSVPQDQLDEEALSLARRLALIDPDLLTVNKRVVNLALELMGARTLQRLALELDVRGHQSATARHFFDNPDGLSLKDLLEERDRGFGDGRIPYPET